MVPMLCVGTQSGTLQRPEPQSGSGCIPTQSAGTMADPGSYF
jgi:hypothetical protein